jgi:hypothetical protein
VTYRRTKALDLIGPVYGVALLGEEHRVRHQRVIPFLGEVLGLHSEYGEIARRRRVACLSRRDRPSMQGQAVARHLESLRGFVDFYEERSRVRLSRGGVEPIDERIQDQTVATSEVTPLDRVLNSATGL